MANKRLPEGAQGSEERRDEVMSSTWAFMTAHPEGQLMADRPTCELAKQWDQSKGGLVTARYAGADGCIYEHVRPISGDMFWWRVEHHPVTVNIP
jgi:hypothetical protein